MPSGGTFDYPAKRERLEEVRRELEDPDVWAKPDKAQELGRERARLEGVVDVLDRIDIGLKDSRELFDIAAAEHDEDALAEIEADVQALAKQIGELEFQRMFSG